MLERCSGARHSSYPAWSSGLSGHDCRSHNKKEDLDINICKENSSIICVPALLKQSHTFRSQARCRRALIMDSWAGTRRHHTMPPKQASVYYKTIKSTLSILRVTLTFLADRRTLNMADGVLLIVEHQKCPRDTRWPAMVIVTKVDPKLQRRDTGRQRNGCRGE